MSETDADQPLRPAGDPAARNSTTSKPTSSKPNSKPTAGTSAPQRSAGGKRRPDGATGKSGESKSLTKSGGDAAAKARRELDILIRARYPIIYVTTWEEERVERCLREIAKARKKQLFEWTITQGLSKVGTDQKKGGTGNTTDPIAALSAVIDHVDPAIYLFKDFHHFTEDTRCNLTIIRRPWSCAIRTKRS